MKEKILGELRASGHRLTRTRRKIIGIFTECGMPLTAVNLLTFLAERGIECNKTTLYRELEFLKGQGIISAVSLGDGRTRYELAEQEHHHHVVCVDCRQIGDVTVDESFTSVEETLALHTGFKVFKHSLEFFGLCGQCQKRA